MNTFRNYELLYTCIHCTERKHGKSYHDSFGNETQDWVRKSKESKGMSKPTKNTDWALKLYDKVAKKEGKAAIDSSKVSHALQNALFQRALDWIVPVGILYVMYA